MLCSVTDMDRYIGIDLGTSSVKVILVSSHGIEKSAQRSYELSFPQPDRAEQNPCDWYEQTLSALEQLLEDIDKSSVRSMAFSGQMHGLVILDKNDKVLRPAVLWNDQRSVKEVEYLNNVIGKDFLLENTGNIAFAGFTAPKLLWVKENEPHNFSKIKKIMLPKDYLAYMLSGSFATDVSDASGTLYFDVKNRRWSDAMLNLIGIDVQMLPRVYESSDVIGNIKADIAKRLGLRQDVQIIIGGGDNACAAVGTSTVKNGQCNISLGTSGTVYVETDKFNYDKDSAVHAFCSANGRYHYLACILSAASCQKWWIEDILKTGYDFDGAEKYIGHNDVCFLPYLMGERSPINSSDIRGMFYGISFSTSREQMTLSVLEGVAFALRQNIDIIKKLGVKIQKSRICGGGTKTTLWLSVIADILGIELEIPAREQGAALGAALLAAKGVMGKSEYTDFCAGFDSVVRTVKPDSAYKEYYENKYRQFLRLQDSMLKLYAD